MNIKFIAQSGFILEDGNERLCIDLWLNNPVNTIKIEEVPTMNYVFVTHDHKDHDMQTGIEIAKRDNAIFFANVDITKLASQKGVQKVERQNIGGTIISGNIEVAQVKAEHNSDTGIPIGFIIKFANHTIYHMGDTGYFKGLDVLSEIYNIDILMVPIGSRYTMDSIEASYVVKDIKPKLVIPMHYNTSVHIQQNPEIFKSLTLSKYPLTNVAIMKPGETIVI